MKKRVVVSVVAASIFMSSPAFATNGYFTHGYGMTHKGMAGAGVAVSEELMSAANNPANLLVKGSELSVGLELFAPDRNYAVAEVNEFFPGAFYLQGPGKRSAKKLFAIPEFAFGQQLNDQVNVGILIYANGGMNTEYQADAMPEGTFYAGTTGVDLKQLFISPTLSYQWTQQLRVGVAPVLVVQQFSAQGLASFAPFSQAPTSLSDNGSDFSSGIGLQLGLTYLVSDAFTVGASYRSAVSMGEFDQYAGLFAEQGDFDLPSALQVGLAWQINRSHQVLLDLQHINYGEVSSVANPIGNIMSAPLGASNGAGFGWQDMTVYKLGYQWQRTEQQKIRFGVSYGEQPISSSQVLFNILAPGVQEWHFTTGLSQSLAANVQMNLTAFYSPTKTVTGANFLAPNQQLSIAMQQHGVGASVAWAF
ncbi:MAG: outer membrane protein transport protein [Alishewanella sp.]|nr:outer membrane protein transport protein [Alishewanella sp.]